MDEGMLLPVWVLGAVWLGYGALGFYFMFSRNLERKRRFWRPYVLSSGVLFLLIALAVGFPLFAVIILAPFVALITYSNLKRGIQFCDQCGSTVWSMVPFSKPRHCSHCGAPLKAPAA